MKTQTTSYPSLCGYKAEGASRATAERMDLDSWKQWSYLVIADALARKPMTVKEILEELRFRYPSRMVGRDKCSLRPRFSEMKKARRIIESGDRRNGESVWMLTSC
ncbi:MAG: hypothetical protein KGL39_17990 [Patescibacteria group bacterium]|nr:hypothetical protein [Patescibacteria group bacterium]